MLILTSSVFHHSYIGKTQPPVSSNKEEVIETTKPPAYLGRMPCITDLDIASIGNLKKVGLFKRKVREVYRKVKVTKLRNSQCYRASGWCS